MSRSTIPAKKKSFLKSVSAILLYCIVALGLSSDSLFADPYSMVRAGRWDKILSYFRHSQPGEKEHRYILARAFQENSEKKAGNLSGSADTVRAISLYLSAIGIDCQSSPSSRKRSVDEQKHLLGCLQNVAARSKAGLIERLSLYRASVLAEKLSMQELQHRLLEIADPSAVDPLSAKIYSEHLQLLYQRGQIEEGSGLAGRYRELDTGFTNLWRAKHYQKAARTDEAYDMYVRAARVTTVEWLQKIIYRDMKAGYSTKTSPYVIRTNKQIARELVPLIRFMDTAEQAAMKEALSYSDLLSTSSTATMENDGFFLIETGQAERLPDYSAAYYTALSRDPDILYDWVKEMDEKRDGKALRALVRQFEHIRNAHSYLWKRYIYFLRDHHGSKEEYFNEMIEYLDENRTDHHVFDDLLEFLIGKNHQNVQWASWRYWKQAKDRLPADTGTGRFLYWLKRYYIAHNRQRDARDLQQTFYRSAPGSYYARAFWDEARKGNYVTDWRKVQNRESYLDWISQHGHREEALRFLARQNRLAYLDPQAVRLWNSMRDTRYSVPDEIITLYRLGELDLGYDFFQATYDSRISQMERLARLSYIGRKTGNLFISVYFTRRLIHEANIAEDPFSLPGGLLEELYPRPYQRAVERYARMYRIDAEMVWGLMRQESMFRELAISRSGAMGLMQIMPATGQWMANKMKIRDPDFYNPHTSIQIGARYFSDLLKKYDGDFRWASIAYNGGPGNLRKWKRQYYNGDFNHFLENIPVAEPRHYCRITYQNYMHYKIAYTLHK